MRIKDYFTQSALCFGRSVVLLAKGVYFGVRRLFTSYPNPTWVVIMAGVVVLSVVKIGEARSERDRYSQTTARLQHQLDSCMQKEVKYTSINLCSSNP